VDALLRRLLRAAVRRGLAGDWTWLVIAGCVYVLRRSLNDKGGTVSSLRISPGEQLLISVRDWDAPAFEREDDSLGGGGGSRSDGGGGRRGRRKAKSGGRGRGYDANGAGSSPADAVDDDA
jgi:hypothetical protein